nr:putative V protein [Paraavulavirus hongkongense]
MDFTDIDAVNSLIESSSAIIDSIQHGGLQPSGTVGLSQIPKGITSALTKAWEAEAATAGNVDTQHKADSLEDHQANDTDSPEDTGTNQTIQEANIIETPHPEVLSAAKARLKRPKAGKDTHDNSSAQPDHLLKGGPPEPTTGGTVGAESTHSWRSRHRRSPPITNSGSFPHRREMAIVTDKATGDIELVEWCNPGCTAIRTEPTRLDCVCGHCPTICSLCMYDD